VAIFANGPGNPQTTAVTTSATLVFDTDATSIPTGATLPDLTIVNLGANTAYLGGSTVTTATGLPIPSGGQVTIRGYSGLQSSTTGDTYAICASNKLTTLLCGLATLDPVA
jgi:hypothetical protein